LAAAGSPVRPSLKAAARTVQTAQLLERKLLILREGTHACPPSEMPPTLAVAAAAGSPVRLSLKAAARTVQTAQLLERKLLIIREGTHACPPSEMPPTLAVGSAAAGLAAAGVEAAGSAKTGLALTRETRTVADVSSPDADGHPRLRRMRTRTDTSWMSLGSSIDRI
jgi:hypothetical protein